MPLFEAAGWLIREDSQFHWTNRGYGDFGDFLADLSSEKRKNIRKERARAVAGLEIVHLTGGALTEAHWDIFWDFYQDTGARKWGTPYLTRSFFSLLSETMADKVLLVLALREGRAIAGALNLIGGDALYGRYWGCSEDVANLHFELCYYQAIDIAIARGLKRVEAGAQGGHKLARGYAPEPTWSAHHIPNPGFRRAVADFLAAERAGVQQDRQWLAERTPFRKGERSGDAHLRRDHPGARLALGLGNLAGGHFLGDLRAHRLAFLATAQGGQVEPFMRFDKIDRHAARATAIGDAQIETALRRSACRVRQATFHQKLRALATIAHDPCSLCPG